MRCRSARIPPRVPSRRPGSRFCAVACPGSGYFHFAPSIHSPALSRGPGPQTVRCRSARISPRAPSRRSESRRSAALAREAPVAIVRPPHRSPALSRGPEPQTVRRLSSRTSPQHPSSRSGSRFYVTLAREAECTFSREACYEVGASLLVRFSNSRFRSLLRNTLSKPGASSLRMASKLVLASLIRERS